MGKKFETNSSFYVKLPITGKIQVLFFRILLLALIKLSFCTEDRARRYNLMKFLGFYEIFDIF